MKKAESRWCDIFEVEAMRVWLIRRFTPAVMHMSPLRGLPLSRQFPCSSPKELRSPRRGHIDSSKVLEEDTYA